MKTFKQFMEAFGKLRIVQKAADKPKNDPKMSEPKEPQEDERIIGKVGKYTVIRTHHMSHTRDYEKKARDYGMEKKDFLRVVELMLKKTTPQEGKKYHLFYKHGGKYNNLVVKVEGNEIVVLTVMQMQKSTVQQYFSQPGDLRLTVESVIIENEEYIYLGILI